MNHIVDRCPLTKFEGGLNLLHKVDDDAVMWLESAVTAALVKKGKGSPYSTAEHRVPELIPVLGSQPAVTLATLKRAATSFAAW